VKQRSNFLFFGKKFCRRVAPSPRRLRLCRVVLFVVFGALTGLQAPRIAANLPTPWVGVWQRINIGVFLLWVVVLVIALLRAPVEQPPR
jgi:hypothetical protein